MHMSGSPFTLACSLHIAAGIPDFLALEHHYLDLSWYDGLVDGLAKPIVQSDGYAIIPEGRGSESHRMIARCRHTSRAATYVPHLKLTRAAFARRALSLVCSRASPRRHCKVRIPRRHNPMTPNSNASTLASRVCVDPHSVVRTTAASAGDFEAVRGRVGSGICGAACVGQARILLGRG